MEHSGGPGKFQESAFRDGVVMPTGSTDRIMTAVRVRGIYATALTAVFETVVQPSPAIAERFEQSFAVEPADVVVESSDDRQGVGIHGRPEGVADVVSTLETLGIDTFVWDADLSKEGIYAGRMTEDLGSGAIVDCGAGTGFLPYSNTDEYLEPGDTVRVQVTDPRPPWEDGRPVLDTAVRVHGTLASLVRGDATDGTTTPNLADIVPAEPPAGWRIERDGADDEVPLEVLGAEIDRLADRAASIDDALSESTSPEDLAPGPYWERTASYWAWFGRESRFALDDRRREIVPTMPGHHRIKAGASRASDAVDFVEAVCPDLGERQDSGEGHGRNPADAFPFEAVVAQFGPTVGDTMDIAHGKPDGRCLELGPGTVTDISDQEVTIERELSAGGTYDALRTPIQEGDVATTTVRAGRWWYRTVYRGVEGELRGTYVNVCTPVEVFPREVRYVDLHVDVVRHPDGTVNRVDEDDLTTAVDQGHLDDPLAEKARAVASAVENAL